ncbi:MAG: endonuclease/exonuclease/phosphatase family protein [Oscillospiraceae bacterium]|nr:endonuclease/exonuclease/phosphatase family protein [Oscillospiraceae bacterium]
MKLHNWREYFCKQQFDFCNFNEYVPYIDPLASSAALTGTKLTTAYVLKPQFRYFDSSMDTSRKDAVIASKYPISNEAEYTLAGTTNNGYCRYYNVTIDENHVIGVYAIQMAFLSAPGDTYDSAASIANRKAQMDSLATIISNHSDDYIVVMGDMNTGASADHTNVANFCSANNLIPCNGGFLDWIRTYESSALCLDNILVSNNIHVNNFDSHSDWYEALSTDHYGISAEIVLT